MECAFLETKFGPRFVMGLLFAIVLTIVAPESVQQRVVHAIRERDRVEAQQELLRAVRGEW